jgi:glycosyltransferase involved in cell wall biosynthesis
MKVAVFLEMAGVNSQNSLSGPYAGGKTFINAVKAHSKHEVTFFSTKVTDPEVIPYLNRMNYFSSSDRELESVISEFDVVHVLNGKKTALKISRITGQAILGPNVVFSIPNPTKLAPEVRVEKATLLEEEEAVCHKDWSYLLTPNPTLEPLFKARFKGKHDPIIAFPYGVDTERFCPESKTIRNEIVWIGGGPNRPGKGADLIEKVAAALPKEKWVLLGKDSLFRYGDHIPHLQRAKVYVVTTAHETQGLATFEAMACGAPIVIANYKFESNDGKGSCEQSPRYHINGVTSKIVARNVDSIVKEVQNLLDSSHEREELARKSLAYVRGQFSLQSMVRQYDALISRKAKETEVGESLSPIAKNQRDKGNLEESILNYKLLTESEPFNPHPLYFLGTAYMYKEEHIEARQYFEKVLELAPGHTSARECLEKVNNVIDEKRK